MARAVRRYKELAGDLETNQNFVRLARSAIQVNNHILSEQMSKTVRTVAEQLTIQFDFTASLRAAVESINASVSRQVFESVRAFEKKVIPQMLPDYSVFMRDLAANRKTEEAIGRLMRDVSKNVVMPMVIRPEEVRRMLEPFRVAAERAVFEWPTLDARNLVEGLNEAKVVLELEGESETEAPRYNLVLLVAVLASVFTFLANQDKILKQGFEDLAALSHLLADIWQYAVVVLYVIVVGIHGPSDGTD